MSVLRHNVTIIEPNTTPEKILREIKGVFWERAVELRQHYTYKGKIVRDGYAEDTDIISEGLNKGMTVGEAKKLPPVKPAPRFA